MKTSSPSVPQVPQAGEAPCHALPPRWSPEARQMLDAFLMERQDQSVCLSARDVRKLDCLMVQYVVAAARAWTARGKKLAITDRDPDFDAALTLIGVTPDMLHGRA